MSAAAPACTRFEFKGGTGTSSRRVRVRGVADYTVGVLVQSNFGRRWQLQVAGIPVGREWPEDAPFTQEAGRNNELGSIIVVVATDAPLLPTQLKRIARRAMMGIARTGGMAGNGSGDIFVAFSTANTPAANAVTGLQQATFLPNDELDGLFEATVRRDRRGHRQRHGRGAHDDRHRREPAGRDRSCAPAADPAAACPAGRREEPSALSTPTPTLHRVNSTQSTMGYDPVLCAAIPLSRPSLRTA